MNAPAKPRRAFVLALVAACGAGASASTNSSTTPRDEPLYAQDQTITGQPERPAGRSPGACVGRLDRTYVALSDGMSLDDFDLAANESKQVLKLVEDQLCVSPSALEPSGRLAADLAAHRLVLFEVVFVRDDASAADVGLRRIDAPNPGPRGDYRVAAVRGDQGWRLAGVTLP